MRHARWRLTRRTLNLILIVSAVAMAQPGGVFAGELAWTQDRVGKGMHPQGGEAVVLYERTKLDPPVPVGALVTRVHASRRYGGSVELETRLCWRSPTGPCVLFLGSQVNTHQFDGLSAQGPFVLVHRVKTWGNTVPPLFVSGAVTVWFDGQH